ncbi:DUF6444 domain-containing protein [Okeania sp. SIO2C2]|uniref:DUF6444 domain-containing protein n=1 Tax=Okeania sp. SIO2C2 TaxID=2607787 RepID=UPI00338EF0CF
MDEQHLRSIPGIDGDDWEQTPVSVRRIVVQLILKVEQVEPLFQLLKELEIENQQLRKKLDRNSRNSHSPPTSDPPNRQQGKKKKPTGKKRGGQLGHQGQRLFLNNYEVLVAI